MELKDIKGETRSLYDVTIIESVDGGYVGFLKDKPGVMSMGETKDELIENMRDALRTMTAYEHERSING